MTLMNYFYISPSYDHFESITEEHFRRIKSQVILVGSEIEYRALVDVTVGYVLFTDKTLRELYESLKNLDTCVVITNVSIEALTEFSKRTAVLNGTSYENPFYCPIKELK